MDDQIQNWLTFANEDLKVAKITSKEKVYNASCFHSQQAVEKVFKALLLHYKNKVPKQHSLEKLRLELEKSEIKWKRVKDDTRFLDEFYVPTRYPDALPGSLAESLPNETDAKKALKIAQKVLKLASKEFNKPTKQTLFER